MESIWSDANVRFMRYPFSWGLDSSPLLEDLRRSAGHYLLTAAVLKMNNLATGQFNR